jgi:putative colanic acid biosysnthesis UDP-glucose lipid carrier transferase
MRDASQAASDRASLAWQGERASLSRMHPKVRLATAEPPSIALLRQLLNPTVTVASLFLCVLAVGQPLTGQYLALAALAFIVSGQVFSPPLLDHASVTSVRTMWRQRVFPEWILIASVLLLLAFAFKVSENYSRKVILLWLVFAPFAVLAAQSATRRFAVWSAMRGTIAQSHVIIGANQLGRELGQRLRSNPHLGRLKGFFDDRDIARLSGIADEQLLGPIADVADYVRLNNVSNIYVCLPIRPESRTLKLFDELRDTTASIYFVPDIFMFDLIQARCTEIDGIPLVAVCETPFCGIDGVVKRVADVLLAAGAIAILWPLMMTIACGVKLSSPGPVIFRQRRYGLAGEEILVYKFRSMHVLEDGAVGTKVAQATREDPRVTRFGAFMRRTSLDELPQLFNVLLGSMSMVGPRPHAVAHNEEYRKLINGYMLRHKVRPGITGWAQVNGLRGETDTVDKMKRRVEYDLDYLRHWSLGLDLRILFRTLSLVWRDRNAY